MGTRIINRGNVGDGDLYSIRPEVAQGGHVMDSAMIQSEENSESSSVVELS
jgi:hypothetical protein